MLDNSAAPVPVANLLPTSTDDIKLDINDHHWEFCLFSGCESFYDQPTALKFSHNEFLG